MELNLHIICEEFRRRGYEPQSRIIEDHSIRNLEFPSPLVDNAALNPRRLYTVMGDELGSIAANSAGALSFLCLEKPDENVFEQPFNLVWFEREGLEIYPIAIEVADLFLHYNNWHLSLQDALTKEKPIRVLGELSTEIIGRPVLLWSMRFETIFSIEDGRSYRLPADYVSHQDASAWPEWELNCWKDTRSVEASSSTGPYLLPQVPGLFSYRTLCYDLFVRNERVATLAFDEVGEEFSARDYALISFLGEIIVRGIKHDSSVNISAAIPMVKIIEDLLERREVSPKRLTAAVQGLGWLIDDQYCCIVAVPTNPFYAEGTLAATAEKVSCECKDLVYVIYEQHIVFIGNLTRSQLDCDAFIVQVETQLRERRCRTYMGVSNIFDELIELPSFHRQAMIAIELGTQSANDGLVLRFDDYLSDYIAQCCNADITPVALCPSGLLKLMHHDREHGTDFAALLEAYIAHDCCAKDTAEALFLHRNTFFSRLQRIEALSGLQLDDPEVKMQLVLAFRLLKQQ